jgi:glycosyltransferase involved in cell wall biosynthesis
MTLIRFKLLILFARLLGYRIVWTMHNLKPHEPAAGRLDDDAIAFMAAHASTAVHCERARELLEEKAGLVRTAVIPHGNYIGYYPVRHSRESARKELGIDGDKTVFLFFGMIRMYKGIGELCESFRAVGAGDAMLLIAGKPYEEREEDFIDAVREEFTESGIRFVCDFIPDDEVAKYFLACDFAVFPYRNVLTSGSVILALGFGRSIIAPRIGCIAELEDEGVGIFYDPEEEGGLERAIRAALRVESTEEMARRARDLARGLSWRTIAEEYLSLYGQGG